MSTWKDSLTRVPGPSSTRLTRHSLESKYGARGTVRQTSVWGLSARTTSLRRVHRKPPRRLRPLKRAPGFGASAPSTQAHPRHSPLHSPTRVTSEITAHTASGDEATVTSASQFRRTLRPSDLAMIDLIGGRTKAYPDGQRSAGPILSSAWHRVPGLATRDVTMWISPIKSSVKGHLICSCFRDRQSRSSASTTNRR